jgi:hypothetical protein
LILISESNNTNIPQEFKIIKVLNLKNKIDRVVRHPSVIKSLIYGKKINEIRSEIDKIDSYETM